MKIKKTLSMIMSLLMIAATFSGCNAKNKVENNVEALFSKADSDGLFNNTTENDFTPTPGSFGTGVYASEKGVEGDKKLITLSAASSHGYKPEFSSSLLQDEEKLQYYYSGNGYCYGITADGKEVISYKENENEKFDVLYGAGKFSLYNTSGADITQIDGIDSFQVTEISEKPAVKVIYKTAGKGVSLENTYIFEERNISVLAKVNYDGSAGSIDANKSIFKRSFIADYQKVEKRISYEWIYPDNGEQVKPWYESIVTTVHLDERRLVYSFNRNENSPDNHVLKSYPNIDFPLHLSENCEALDYTLCYDLVLETVEKDKDSDYLALFEGKGSDIAVGIAPVQSNEEYDNTTVFTGEEITLNLNVTNIASKESVFSLRYDLMDYYGNIVDSGIFIDNKISYGGSANHHITVKDKYGMYYLNIYAVCGEFSHRECYPFMLIPSYEYKHRKTNHFGIDASHHNTISQAKSVVSLLKKTGAAFVRPGASADDKYMYSLLGKNDVEILLGLGGSASYTKEQIYNNVSSNLAAIPEIEKLCGIRYAYVSNEPDHTVKGNLDACRQFMQDTFMPNIYNPLKELVNQCAVPTGWAGTCHANRAFFTAMYENGVWQDSDIIDSHLYSQPKGPDASFASSKNVSSIEWEMISFKESVDEYGKEGKKIAIGETGYSANSTDLRTLADFNTRTGILSLVYGIDYVGFYCMFDRTTYYEGTGVYSAYGGETEMNFGMFYNYDYFGVFKPKPWAAAFATLNDQTDGVIKCNINSTYTTETTAYLSKTTMRVFDIETSEKGAFKVAWSNIQRIPRSWSSDVNAEMIKNLQWNNQWTSTESVTFKAASDTVTVIDIMGNKTVYTPTDGTIKLEISGSPVYIYGVE